MHKLLVTFCLIASILSNANSQSNESKTYIFGHSLLDHRPPAIPTPSDETTVPHWLQLLADHANKEFAATGKYGFLPQHANDPVFAQWGYDIVNPAWDSDTETFSQADFSTCLITAGNFIQWQPHTMDYYGNPGVSPLTATLDVLDFIDSQDDSIKVIIYENWPEMNPPISTYPPTTMELETYYNTTAGSFHDWWVAYHNDLDAMRPNMNVKMIPVGPIFSDLFLNTALAGIPATELYEDLDPHGRASLYFIASLVSYVAIYEEKPPLDFVVPSIVHSLIAENYEEIVDRIWTHCLNFNFNDGRSRVFTQSGIVNSHIYADSGSITFYPNPVTDYLHLKGELDNYSIQILDSSAAVYNTYTATEELVIDLTSLPSGVFYIRLINSINNDIRLRKIVKQ